MLHETNISAEGPQDSGDSEIVDALRRGLFNEERMFRVLTLMTDLTARTVALENLSLHLFADEIFS